jgi:hypothetical protein
MGAVVKRRKLTLAIRRMDEGEREQSRVDKPRSFRSRPKGKR